MAEVAHINHPKVSALADRLKPDVVAVFGTGLIVVPLLAGGRLGRGETLGRRQSEKGHLYLFKHRTWRHERELRARLRGGLLRGVHLRASPLVSRHGAI